MLSWMNAKIACLMAGASVLGGCSFLYNPTNLPGPVDAYVDPAAPVIESAGPQTLFEGQGTGGSRPAILAITGHNFAPDAIVALLPTNGADPAPMIEIDNAHITRGANVLAVPVMLPIDTNLGTAGETEVKLTVQVTQMGPEGPVAGSLEGRVVVHNLPELDAQIPSSTMLAGRYSRVNVPAGLTFPALETPSPVVIRAVGSIDLGDVHADASGPTPGPGGGAGGAPQRKGGGPGGGAGSSVLGASVGGVISSDDWIVSYVTSGSGGGGGGVVPGGGGGATLEITAGGTLTTGKISVNGENGTDGGTLGDGGSGGSGGAIVLRSGGAATLGGAITASGGAAGAATVGRAGGPGGAGRLRYDVPSLAGTPPPAMSPATRRGVAFGAAVGTNPLVTTKDHPDLDLVSAMGSTQFDIIVRDADNNTTASTNVIFTTPNVIITPALRPGYNQVCVMPPGGSPTLLESTNCIDIAYVP